MFEEAHLDPRILERIVDRLFGTAPREQQFPRPAGFSDRHSHAEVLIRLDDGILHFVQIFGPVESEK
jgi:hypothetical protein